ncbi:invasion associated locus B family protein [Reyranella sp.]|uniref:invasion associated locus B family protein n=1 Tax=Reyranella sp. TaxID=1929291 RepID=UPI003BACD6F1
MKRFAVGLGLSLLAASASAQPVGQNQPPDQWVMNCNYEKGKDCTVSAMIDGGPNNLLGTFLIVSYSVAYTTLTVAVDGIGQRASIQVDSWPFVSTTICTGGACSFEQGRSAELLKEFLRGSQVTVQVSTREDVVVGPLQNTLKGFAEAYQQAVAAQKR